MPITVTTTLDPVGEFKMANAYMRWALVAAEEVAGKRGMSIVLREAGLARLVDNYPPEDFTTSAGTTARDYTALCTGLLNFFGRAGRGSLVRIGRKSMRFALEKQNETFGFGAMLAAARLLPAGIKLKAGLDLNVSTFVKIYKDVGANWIARIEDRGDRWAYVVDTCALCVDRHADTPICTMFTGLLTEGTVWLMGKEYEVRETECRAMGAKACVWEVSKTPKEG